jgi:hypothetical protein
MSLLSVLKTVGKDLKDVAGWIDDGLKLVTPGLQAVDPSIASIFTIVETILGEFTATPLTAAQIQQITTGVATLVASLNAGHS